MHSVSIVEVEGRVDGTYVFAFESHAERFRDAVRANGGRCEITEEALNCSEEHLTPLILAEHDG